MAGSSGAPTEGMFGIHSYGGGQTVDGGAPPLRAGCFCIYTSKNGRRERVRLERVGDNDGDPGALERAESLCTVSRWQNGQRLEAEVPRQRLRVLATPVGALRERIRNRLPGVRRAFAGIARIPSALSRQAVLVLTAGALPQQARRRRRACCPAQFEGDLYPHQRARTVQRSTPRARPLPVVGQRTLTISTRTMQATTPWVRPMTRRRTPSRQVLFPGTSCMQAQAGRRKRRSCSALNSILDRVLHGKMPPVANDAYPRLKLHSLRAPKEFEMTTAQARVQRWPIATVATMSPTTLGTSLMITRHQLKVP